MQIFHDSAEAYLEWGKLPHHQYQDTPTNALLTERSRSLLGITSEFIPSPYIHGEIYGVASRWKSVVLHAGVDPSKVRPPDPNQEVEEVEEKLEIPRKDSMLARLRRRASSAANILRRASLRRGISNLEENQDAKVSGKFSLEPDTVENFEKNSTEVRVGKKLKRVLVCSRNKKGEKSDKHDLQDDTNANEIKDQVKEVGARDTKNEKQPFDGQVTEKTEWEILVEEENEQNKYEEEDDEISEQQRNERVKIALKYLGIFVPRTSLFLFFFLFLIYKVGDFNSDYSIFWS